MVGAGTFLSIGIIAAAGVAGYAIYTNLDKIGGALTRGISQSITDPFSSYLDSLFKISGAGAASGPAPGTPLPTLEPNAPVQKEGPLIGFEGSPAGPKLPDDKNLIQTQIDIWYKKNFGTGPLANGNGTKFPDEEHRGANPAAPTNEPLFAPSPGGFYYADYRTDPSVPHVKDLQWKLTEGMADKLRKTIVPGGFLKGIHYLGKSELTEPGFKLFGKSQNYL